MPLDAICMQAVVRETAAQIENARIEKIQQPARDQGSCCCGAGGACCSTPEPASPGCI